MNHTGKKINPPFSVQKKKKPQTNQLSVILINYKNSINEARKRNKML